MNSNGRFIETRNRDKSVEKVLTNTVFFDTRLWCEATRMTIRSRFHLLLFFLLERLTCVYVCVCSMSLCIVGWCLNVYPLVAKHRTSSSYVFFCHMREVVVSPMQIMSLNVKLWQSRHLNSIKFWEHFRPGNYFNVNYIFSFSFVLREIEKFYSIRFES